MAYPWRGGHETDRLHLIGRFICGVVAIRAEPFMPRMAGAVKSATD